MRNPRGLVRTLLRNWAMALMVPRPVVGVVHLPRYLRDWYRFRALAPEHGVRWVDSYPCLGDHVRITPFDPHYFYQGAWLARLVVAAKPTLHVDVGSSALTISVLSGLCPTVFLDYRPVLARVQGMMSVGGDITQLPISSMSLESLSCLHVIEHVGLGRYGDRLDPAGSGRAAAELMRVLAPGGALYLSVPVGRERTCFNAHRVLSPATIVGWFKDLTLRRFALVGDDGSYTESASLESAQKLEYGCGMFEFVRP